MRSSDLAFAFLLAFAAVWLTPSVAEAQPLLDSEALGGAPLLGVLLLVLVPVLLVLGSAFVKVSVVLGILRNALGAQDVPSPLVITALSMLIAVLVMIPVVSPVLTTLSEVEEPVTLENAESQWQAAAAPLVGFLERNSSEQSRTRFVEVVSKLDPQATTPVAENDLRVLLPSFVATELTEAFLIGFLILLPFLVLDIVVTAITQAAGLSALQPNMVSLPLKLILFVSINGWQLLLEGLMLGYS